MNIFSAHAHFCAAYSPEVLIFFFTTFVGSISLSTKSSLRMCDWSFNNCSSGNDETTRSHSNLVLLTILRCSTIIYLFIKLRSISKVGSRHVLYAVLVCVIMAMIVFSAVMKVLLGTEWSIVGDALSIFLLLIDLSRIVALVKHTLASVSNKDMHEKIAEALKIIGPVYTVDTILEVLVIFTASFVNIQQLNELSCFAILSLCINFMIFTTFVPACLSSYLTAITNKPFAKNSTTLPIWHKTDFFNCLERDRKRETLTMRVKIAICGALFCFNVFRMTLYPKLVINDLQSSFDSIFNLSSQQMFTLTILMLLATKLIEKIDKTWSENENQISLSLPKRSVNSIHLPTQAEQNENYDTTVPQRDSKTCMELVNNGMSNVLSDEEIMTLVNSRKIMRYKLEATLQDPNRAVDIRRKLLIQDCQSEEQKCSIQQIPHANYNFGKATKACCENTIGYVPVPVGVAGPLLMNGEQYLVPLATTEGTLVASTNRGMKALMLSGGVKSTIYRDGMTRSPVVQFPSTSRCCEAYKWIEDAYNFEVLKDAFDSTSRFAKLNSVTCSVAGRQLYIRFQASTGDAMGMNMVSKGAECALKTLQNVFEDMRVISVSGNFCCDKKPSAVNWIMGRGKSVVSEAMIRQEVIKKVLKTDLDALIQTSFHKNQVGSAMAGSIGGNNAHAANIVTALFIATGQDPAQNVESSNCMTVLEKVFVPNESGDSEEALLITCTMPSIEVATVGGGTILDAQNASIKLLDIPRSNSKNPGEKSSELAKIVAASVLAGEISLLSALSAGHLVESHMKHNRIHHTSNNYTNAHPIL